MDNPVLKSIQFENYRCLRDVRIEFEPLTVLVGGNATGKSSVLRGVCEPTKLRFEDRWMRQAVRTQFALTHQRGVWTCTLDVDQGAPSLSGEPFSGQLLQLELPRLRAFSQLNLSTRVETDGRGLANTFVSLPRRQQAQLAERFCSLVPMFGDVGTVPVHEGAHTFRFQDRWNESVWYTPDQVSDGTMLVLAYLLLMYQQPQVELVAIEEPERGLHPFLLGELVQFFRAMTRGEIGPHPVQVVLATHSAGILDHVEPREVRLLSRDRQSGEVRVETIDESTQNWRAAYAAHEHSLGGIWLSGGIGGVPSR